MISISAADFGGDLISNQPINVDQFVIGAGAMDSSDRFIYNSRNGALYFDSDGSGSIPQINFAQLSSGLSLSNNNIFVNFDFSI